MAVVASVFFALVAAVLFGLGTAAQHRVSASLRDQPMLRLRLFRRLLGNPLWVTGIAFEIGAFGFQLAALHQGALVIVQPIITLSLVIALVVTAAVLNERLGTNDFVALGGVIVGLATFLAVTVPSAEASSRSTPERWALAMTVVGGVGAGAMWIGQRSLGASRAGAFALATGVSDAIMAAFAKAFSDEFGRGFGVLVTSWTLYAVAAMGIAALLLQQSAYQTARPAITLPVIAVVEPLVSVVLGVVVFREHLARGLGRDAVALLSLAVLVVALAVLARSPLADDTVKRYEVNAR